MKQMDTLDGIRGYAIIMVMMYHFTQVFQHLPVTSLSPFEWFSARIFEGMWLGVDLFFVMSGFLITSILLNTAGKPDYFKNFYVRRFLRIFPLFYAVLLVLMLVAPLLSEGLKEQTQVLRDNAFWFLTYTINLRIADLGDFRDISAGYMWSLAVEEQFYMVWPLIVLMFRKHLATLCFSLVTALFGLKIVLHLSGAEGATIYAFTLTHMDGLLLGSGLAALYANNDQSVPKSFKSIIYGLAFVSFAGVVGLIVSNGHLAFYEGLNPVISVTAFSIIFMAILIKTLSEKNEGLFSRLFLIRPIMFCGKLCYGLYLLHHPIGVLVEKTLGSRLEFLSPLHAALIISMVSLVLSLIAAYTSFHVFEKHFLHLKRHFETKATA